MDFLGLLSVATIVVAFLSVVLWWKTRAAAFPIGAFFLYYWSLYGGWAVVSDGLGRDSGKRYHYLFDRLFVVHLDRVYFTALVYYALFIVLVLLAALWNVRGVRPSSAPGARLRLLHSRVLFICAAALAASYLIMSDALSVASSVGISGYIHTRQGPSELFTLHQVLNRVAIVPAALGLAVYASGGDARFIVCATRPVFGRAYAAVLLTAFAYCIALGNKNELFFALVAAVLLYLSNARKPRLGLLAGVGIAAFAGIAWIDLLRGKPLNAITSGLNLHDIVSTAYAVALSSNEAFGAHFSLYGALQYDVPFTYGRSLLSLAASVVPRIAWSDRPGTVYEHYAAHVGAVSGQGYSIHHAAGWYLNFGVTGIVVGAVLLGSLWAALYNKLGARSGRPRTLAGELFSTIAFMTFTANLPALLRAGPEAYKGVAVDAFLIPFVCFYLAMGRKEAA